MQPSRRESHLLDISAYRDRYLRSLCLLVASLATVNSSCDRVSFCYGSNMPSDYSFSSTRLLCKKTVNLHYWLAAGCCGELARNEGEASSGARFGSHAAPAASTRCERKRTQRAFSPPAAPAPKAGRRSPFRAAAVQAAAGLAPLSPPHGFER